MSPRKNSHVTRDWVETITFWIVGIGLSVIPLLVFFFSFGNVGAFLESLGIEHRIAYLNGPAVDLAVMVLVVATSYLSTRGSSERHLWPAHLSALACGLIMIWLNTGAALHVRHWRLAAVDCVGPALLIGWGALAPWLWRNLTEARRQSSTSAAPAANRDAARHRASTAAPAKASAPGTEAAVNPAASADAAPLVPSSDAAPARQRTGSEARAEDGSGHVVVPFAAAPGRRSPADWAKLALPLWTRHVEQAGATPTATELAALLRHAHPGLAIPASDRWERNLRSVTEELANADQKQNREQEAG